VSKLYFHIIEVKSNNSLRLKKQKKKDIESLEKTQGGQKFAKHLQK